MFWYAESHHLWSLNLYFSSTVLVIFISVAQVFGTKMHALIIALSLFRKCNLAWWHSFQALTTSKPRGPTCTVFFLQLLHTPCITQFHVLLALFSHFCCSASEHHCNSRTMKVTGILNWYREPNKKKRLIYINFLPYDPKVTTFTTSHTILFMSSFSNTQASPL